MQSAPGGTILKSAENVVWGGYLASFADPDGHSREVAGNLDFPLAADGSVQLPD
jgi:hypothetical protein